LVAFLFWFVLVNSANSFNSFPNAYEELFETIPEAVSTQIFQVVDSGTIIFKQEI